MSGPLSLKTSTASTLIPLIADGIMTKFRLQQISWVEPEGEIKYGQYKFEFRTTAPVASKDGPVINPNFPINVIVGIGADGDKDVPEWAQVSAATPKIARIMDSLLGTGDPGNPKGKPVRPDFDVPAIVPQLIGKEMVAKVTITKSKKNDMEFNNLANMTFPGDLK